MCGTSGMNEQLLMKFIDVQTALLCPICPHIAEEIWVIRGKEGFAVSAPFPEAEEYDPVLIESSEFLSDTVRDARLKLKDRLAPKKGKKEEEIPTNCIIYVAKEYPAWQAACLRVLREGIEKDGQMYENKAIAQRMKSEPEVKKYMKKVMPYVQMVKERVGQIGERALDLTSPFDEMQVLNENIDYMTNTLELDGIEVRDCRASRIVARALKFTNAVAHLHNSASTQKRATASIRHSLNYKRQRAVNPIKC